MLGWTTGQTDTAVQQGYCFTQRPSKKNNPQTRSAIRNPQGLTSRNNRAYFFMHNAALVSDLDLILKTTAATGNNNFIPDSRVTAARLIHCEGNFRLKPEHGTFFFFTSHVTFSFPL
jgi:hypothetical protein